METHKQYLQNDMKLGHKRAITRSHNKKKKATLSSSHRSPHIEQRQSKQHTQSPQRKVR